MLIINDRFPEEDYVSSLLEMYLLKEKEDREFHDKIVNLERSKRNLDQKVIDVLSDDIEPEDKRKQREFLALLREKIIAQQIMVSKRWWSIRGEMEELRCQVRDITGWEDQDLEEKGFRALPPV